MYNYMLTWRDGYEESDSIRLMHEKKYSQEEFDDLIKSLVPVITLNYKLQSNPDEPMTLDGFGPYEFYNLLVDILTQKHGFVHPDYSARFDICGIFWDNDETDNIELINEIEKTGHKLTKEDGEMFKSWK